MIVFVSIAAAIFFFVVKPANMIAARRKLGPAARRAHVPGVPERDPRRGAPVRVLHDGRSRRPRKRPT